MSEAIKSALAVLERVAADPNALAEVKDAVSVIKEGVAYADHIIRAVLPRHRQVGPLPVVGCGQFVTAVKYKDGAAVEAWFSVAHGFDDKLNARLTVVAGNKLAQLFDIAPLGADEAPQDGWRWIPLVATSPVGHGG